MTGRSRRYGVMVVLGLWAALVVAGPAWAELVRVAWEALPARVAGKLVPIEQLSVTDCPPGIEAEAPARIVLQCIENTIYRWREYDVTDASGKTQRAIVMVQPKSGRLSRREAQVLLSASRLWDEPAPMPQGESAAAPAPAKRLIPAGSQQGITPGKVIGSDGRSRVADGDVTKYPWKTIACLSIDPSFWSEVRGSGALIAPYALLTAGHCVYDRDASRYAGTFKIIPAQWRDGLVTKEPYGTRTASALETNSTYISNGDSAYDYGLARFTTPFDNISTFMPLVFNYVPSGSINVAGYPATVSYLPRYTMYSSSSTCWTAGTNNYGLHYTADTSGGMSGGPVWEYDGTNRRIVAVHNAGGGEGNNYNVGARLVSDARLEHIYEWMAWSPDPGDGPSNVRATDGDYTDKVQVTWTGQWSVGHHSIYRSESLSGSKTLLARWQTGLRSTYNDTTAAPGQLYYYWVRSALNAMGHWASDYSAADSGYRRLLTPTVTATKGDHTDRVQVNWTTVTGATSYCLYVANYATGSKTVLRDWGGGTSYSHSAADPGKTYYYFVKASGTGSDLQASHHSAYDDGYRKLLPPGTVQASDEAYTDQVRVEWSEVTGAGTLYYCVYRADSAVGTPTELSDWRTSRVYDDASVDPAQTYYYWVRTATSSSGAKISDFSGSNSGRRALEPPGGVRATDGDYTTKVHVRWDNHAWADEFKVYRSTNPASTNPSGRSGWISATTYDDTGSGVTPGTTYYYWVKARRSAYSTWASDFSTSDSGYAALPAPGSTSATQNFYTDRVEVSWSLVTGATHYQVYRSFASNGYKDPQGWQATSGPGVQFYNDTPPEPGKTYYYWVTAAISDTGRRESDFSPSATGWLKLLPPDNVAATDGSYKENITVTWSDVTGGQYYQVYRDSSPSGDWRTGISGWQGSTYYMDSDPALTAGTTYYYWVKAARTLGGSKQSDYSSSDSGWQALYPPTGVSASDGESAAWVRIDWTTTTGFHYRVYRAPSLGGSPTELDQGNPWQTGGTYYDTLVTSGPTFYYYVKAAVDGAGNRASGYSSPDTGWRIPPPEIDSINPTDGPVGSQVWVYGNYFGDEQGDTGDVYFGPSSGRTATPEVISWSNTAINCRAPYGLSPGANEVMVVAHGLDSNTDVSFTVNDPSELCVDDSNTTGAENGTTRWPFNTVTEAIKSSTDNDVIKVARGLYTETVTVDGTILYLRGGYLGGTGYASTAGNFLDLSRDWHVNTTRIAGGGLRCVEFKNGANGELSGFVVMQGNAEQGGGLTCENFSSPAIFNNAITENTSEWSGAGVYCSDSSPAIYNNTITNNTATGFGSFGAGIYIYGSGSAPMITNNTISDNTATGISSVGGGICSDWGSSPTVTNCILWGNVAGAGNEIAVKSTVAASTLTVNYSDVEGGQVAAYVETNCTLVWGPMNVSVNPLFVNATSGDYHLQSTEGRYDPSTNLSPSTPAAWASDALDSPCIDAGDPVSTWTNEPAPNGSWINLGAYGNTEVASKTATLAPPAINSITPNSGPKLSQIWVRGSNFGVTQGASTVTFGPGSTPAAAIISWSNIAINCRVPTGLSLGANNVVVTVGGTPSNAVTFTVTNTDRCVDDSNATGSENGTARWPFNTIGEAINGSTSGDTVKIAQGTYTETVTVDGTTLTIKGGYPGGTDYANTAGDFDDSHRDPNANLTTIDGENTRRGVQFINGAAGELSGLTITRGSATNGAGVYCNGSSPTITGNRIINSTASADGGGVYCTAAAAPALTANAIASNNATNGGGIACDNASPTISHNTITGNTATQQGGGLYTRNAGASPTVTNNTITGNTATAQQGGGICCDNLSSATVKNCVLWGNSAASGNELAVKATGAASTLTVSYSDVEGGQAAAYVETGCTLTWGTGNINTDPLFAAGAEYHLKSKIGRYDPGSGLPPSNPAAWVTDAVNSPCLDGGNPLDDYSSEPAPNGGCINMGAHGGTEEASKSVGIDISVTSPNGGEMIPVDSFFDVYFSVTGGDVQPGDTVTIEYRQSASAAWQACLDQAASPAVNVAHDAGSFRWDTGGLAVTSTYELRVKHNTCPQVEDTSDSFFDIFVDIDLQVTAPNGGEMIPVDSFFDITYSATGDSLEPGDTVRLDYRDSASSPWQPCLDESGNPATSVPYDAGSFHWSTYGLPISSTYELRVEHTEWSTAQDVCDSFFDVFADINVQVISPNGGEMIPLDSFFDITYSITGDSVQPGDTVRIDYREHPAASWQPCLDPFGNPATAVLSDAGTCRWNTAGLPVGSNYDLRVRHNDWPNAEDLSDAFFDVFLDAGVQVTSPNGGESIPVDSFFDITYSVTGGSIQPDDTVQIEYRPDPGSPWQPCLDAFGDPATDVPHDAGGFHWNTAELPISPTYDVRVQLNDHPGIEDLSDSFFDIFVDVDLEVISPNGGESIPVDSFFDVFFDVTGESVQAEDTVRFEYRPDPGSPWQPCLGQFGEPAEAVPHDAGSFRWNTVELSISPTYELRLQHTNRPEIEDLSDSFFDVFVDVDLELITPNGSERIPVDSFFDVFFDASGQSLQPGGTVRFEYRDDPISPWQPCLAELGEPAEAVPCDAGAFRWDTSGLPISINYELRLQYTGRPGIEDLSDGPFEVFTDINIQVTSPNGGETIPIDSFFDVFFDVTGQSLQPGDTVSIECRKLSDPPDTWQLCVDTFTGLPASDVPCDAAPFSWSTSGLTPDDYELRVRHNDWPGIEDTSDASFELLVNVEIATIAPDTGPVGSQLWIFGSGFASTQGSSSVVFGPTQIPAPIISWSATGTVINCRVPDGLGLGAHDVVVIVNSIPSNAVTFTVTDPTELCVDDANIAGAENGTARWPFNTIGEAVGAATGADVIKVAQGTYAETVSVAGATLYLRGGYVGGSDYLSTAGDFDDGHRDWRVNVSTIDGEWTRRCVEFDTAVGGELSGFTVTGGLAPDGGGLYCDASSPTIDSCVFRDNSGGIYADNVSLPIVRRCLLIANEPAGGIYVSGASSTTVTNCTLSRNASDLAGGALSLRLSSSAIVSNCILWENSSEFGEAEIDVAPGSTVDVTYSDVQGGYPGTGNINADPCFADPDNYDYHLMSTSGRYDPGTGLPPSDPAAWVVDPLHSPCIDTGDFASDYSAEPLPNGGRINIGAYGGTEEASKSAVPPPPHVQSLELFYNGKFADAADPCKEFLAVGQENQMWRDEEDNLQGNVTNCAQGITGIRVTFDTVVSFVGDVSAAFSYEATPEQDASKAFSAFTPPTVPGYAVDDSSGKTVVTITFADSEIKNRWLKTTIDASQVSANGLDLDGELPEPLLLPSGDGEAGGNAAFIIGNRIGDADCNYRCLLNDAILIRYHADGLAAGISNAFDIDKNDQVLLNDAILTRNAVSSAPLPALP